jgi:hypothetical protein
MKLTPEARIQFACEALMRQKALGIQLLRQSKRFS